MDLRRVVAPFDTVDSVLEHRLNVQLRYIYMSLSIYNFMCYIKLQFKEDFFTIRTKACHIQDCASVEEDPSLSKTLGVNRRSSLLELEFFDVCGGLIPDVMHDLLEGALQYEAKLLLIYCISEGFFSLSTLNDRIQCVDLDVGCESDRPVTITKETLKSKDNLLKQKGNGYILISVMTCGFVL